MTQYLAQAVEMAGPGALIVLLSTVYGSFRHYVASEATSQVTLGALFGLMSILMMHAPIEPFEGLLIDLRNTPVALAGAFLGIRGLLVCLCLTMMDRMALGGVGASSGVAAMVISGFAGLLWAEWRSQWPRMLWRHYVVLCLMVSTHQFALLLLPAEIALWFFKTATLPLIAINSGCITVVAALMDREIRLLNSREIIAAARGSSLTKAFLSEESFVEVLNTQARKIKDIRDGAAIAGLLAIKLHYAPWIAKTWGEEAIAKVLVALRSRLQGPLTYSDLVALSPDGHVLVPLSEAEVSLGTRIESRVVSAVTADKIILGREEWTRISVSVSTTLLESGRPLDKLQFERPRASAYVYDPVPRKTSAPPVQDWQGETKVSAPLQSALFTKANRLMQ